MADVVAGGDERRDHDDLGRCRGKLGGEHVRERRRLHFFVDEPGDDADAGEAGVEERRQAFGIGAPFAITGAVPRDDCGRTFKHRDSPQTLRLA